MTLHHQPRPARRLQLGRRPVVGPRGWSTRPGPLVGRRGITALLMVVLAGGLFVSVPPPHANADALSDAYAQQKASDSAFKSAALLWMPAGSSAL